MRHQSRNWEWIFFLQNEITGTQTSFSSNFGGKLSFMLSLSFSEFYSCLCYIYFQCSCHVDNYYNYSQTLCINSMYKKKIETLKLSLYPNWEKGRWFGSHPITYYFWMTNPHPLRIITHTKIQRDEWKTFAELLVSCR